MRRFFGITILLTILCLAASCSKNNSNVTLSSDNTVYVNPFIGTGGHGHTFPGAIIPNGMVQLSPDTRTAGWDACGGYHYTDNSIRGFSHTHLSGTGIGDLGDFLFMPFTGEVKINPGTSEDPNSGYRSKFSHDNETAIPGYYTVDLLDYNIKAELTASRRVGFHRYNFLNEDERGVIIDLDHNVHDRNVVTSEFKVISDTEISGYKHINGWARNRHIYFYAKFDQPFTHKLFKENIEQINISELKGKDLVAVLNFDKTDLKSVKVKVGISSVDYEGAKNNLIQEVPHWDFDLVKSEAQKSWKGQNPKTSKGLPILAIHSLTR